MKRSHKLLLRIVLVNTAIALVPPFMMLALIRDVPARRLMEGFKFSFVYAQCSGSLAFATIPRIWVATEPARNAIRWPLRVIAMLLVSFAGALIAGALFVAIGLNPARLYWAEFMGSLKMATFLTFLACTVI